MINFAYANEITNYQKPTEMKTELKKITLYYRELNQWFKDYDACEVDYNEGNIIIFKTAEGGYGIRRQCHKWSVGEKVWTVDGAKPSTVIAVAPHTALEALLNVFRNATYMVNRFFDEISRGAYLKEMEKELMAIAA